MGPEKTFHLQWSGHAENMESSILVDDPFVNADVNVLCSNNDIIKAHRLLLSASSEFFLKLFLDSEATKKPTLVLPDISAAIFQ